jgi:hypothetical protein
MTLFPQRPVNKNTVRAEYHSHSPKLDEQVIERLHKSSNQLLARMVHEQKNAGYKPDHWNLVRLANVSAPILLQSLAHGVKSLCRINDLKLQSLEQTLPMGSSTYFSSIDAFVTHYRIHPGSPGTSHYHNQSDHYAAFTQTRPSATHGYRAHLGIFSLSRLLKRHKELADVHVAISDIKANPEFGKGESKQIAVPLLLLPIIHTCCTRIISHAQIHGVKKVQSTIDPRTGTIEWNFEDRTAPVETNHGIIHLGNPRKR